VHRDVRTRDPRAVAQDLEAGSAGFGFERRRAPAGALRPLARAVPHDAAGRAAHHVAHVRGVQRRDDRTLGGHALHQRAEGLFDVVEVAVDVGVIELDGGDGQRARVVVQELRRLVEERRVVLVPLDDEVRPASFAKAPAEVQGVPPHQHRGVSTGGVQQEGDEARGGGLSVGAAQHDGVSARDGELVERVGERAIGQALVDGGARLGVVRPHGVADDHQVGLGLQHVLGAEALVDGDAPGREQRAHGRIQVSVRAGHAHAARVQEPRQRAHAGAGDGDEVDAARRLAHALTPPRTLRG
jgi:hypothetical protein